MSKQELITRIAGASGESKAAVARVLDALGGTVTDTLRSGGEVHLPAIGKLSVADRAARTGRNPRTGEDVEIAAKRAPKFKPASTLKAALN